MSALKLVVGVAIVVVLGALGMFDDEPTETEGREVEL